MTNAEATTRSLPGCWTSVLEVTPIHEAILLRMFMRWHVLPFASLKIGDCCALIVAPSHGGKSTLITHALGMGSIAGARPILIDDNATWFDWVGRAMCLRRPLRVRKETLETLQTSLPEHSRSSLRGDQSLYIWPNASAACISAHRINTLIVLDRYSRRTQFEVLSARAANEASAYHLRQRLGGIPAPGFVRTLSRVLETERLGCFKLNYSDPSDGIALLEEAVARQLR